MPLKNLLRKRVLLLIVVLFLTAVILPAPLFADPPGAALRDVWQRARDAGGYNFTADAVQTLIPRATTAMIGERNQRVEMHFKGDVSLPAKTNLTLQIDGTGFDPAPIQLIQDGAKTTLIQNGEVIPAENPAGAASLSSDYLAYLTAAEKVSQSTDPDGSTHFTFDIDGAKLAEYVRQQMQASLDANPAAGGARVAVSPLLARMHGQGELWLNANGLPARQRIDFDLPRADENFDAQVTMLINYQWSTSNIQSSTDSPHSLSSRLFLPEKPVKPTTFKGGI